MNEYISRGDVLDIASQYCPDDDGSCSKADVDLREMLDEIEALPTTDVHPMKHGQWIDCTFYDPYEKSYDQNFEFKCSCCGHMIYNKPNNDNLYCGHCGARMELDSVTPTRCSNYMDGDGSCYIDDNPCECDGNIEKCKG